ncbi:TadE/TadG family type IV pilus assembly protein [Nocardioides sp. CER19]|uniref:TadE/TadG family type IV pilus assembly protein n=1 Tax=Nocardioides sp. CER19 TaxID=3038538 RepID=UPI00244872C9|nr:TadE/TadG family type IV pilus assembly protein [Nocardioides sp. CER19]MDH2413238.1 TadE/TadG family type IV pilus assembly protein [Nocardioides sp. CER19]
MRRRDERGSLALEMVMIAPALLLLLGLIYAYGRVGQVNGVMESGARDAARSATLARSMQEARDRAEQVVDDALRAAPPTCRDHPTVTVSGGDPAHPDAFVPGGVIRVAVSCTYDISDLGLPGAPGTLTSRSSFTSMLDPHRGVDD